MSTDGVDVVGETAAEAVVVPVANEVAASKCSGFSVDALQYLIDHVHTFTGLNWWASIAVTTILIRTLLLPLTIYQFKVLSNLNSIRPQVLEINREETESSDKSPTALALGRARVKNLLEKYGSEKQFIIFMLQFTVALSMYAAIVNMAGKNESFKDGGAFWFTDLTTPDAMYVLPVLTALTFWKALLCHADAGLRHVSRPGAPILAAGLPLLLAPCAPKAVLCYWITSNLYIVACGMAMKNPELQKMLGIPNVAGKRYSNAELLVLPDTLCEWVTVVLPFLHHIESI